MSIDAAKQLGERLVEILGLPAGTMWLEFRVSSNEKVTVKCGYFVDINQDSLVEELAEYELHLKAPASPSRQDGK